MNKKTRMQLRLDESVEKLVENPSQRLKREPQKPMALSEAGRKMNSRGGHGPRRVNVEPCVIPGCPNKMHSRHLCTSHLTRWYIHGDTRPGVPLNYSRPLLDAGEDCLHVPLNHGLVSLIDKADRELVEGFNWACDSNPSRRLPYAIRRTSGRHIYLHRVILNAESGMEVDHINRNRLDNRRINLRLATHSQNGTNKPLPKNKTSRFRGVSIYRPGNIWQAQFKFQGKNIGLGHFHSEEDAARAYDEMALRYFGEFAQLNFK